MANIKIDDMAELIAEYMSDYSDDVAEKVKNAVDIVAGEVMDEIKSKIAFNEPTGKYRKAFRLKTVYENKLNKRKTWYVAAPYYRLTHLLELGHVISNGGRTRKFPHIRYGEELAIKRMEELAREAVEK